MLRVLFIEDEPEAIGPVKQELEQLEVGIHCKVEGFDGAEKALEGFLPDIVVLDVFRGTPIAQGDTAGLGSYDSIWTRHFCPIIVYSARPDAVAKRIPKHPFVRSVQKGSGSEKHVVEYIQSFIPHIDALKAVQADVRTRLNVVLRDVGPFAFGGEPAEGKAKELLVRAARRRIAAMADEALEADATPLASWEHYVFPPLAGHLLTGDLIRKKDGAKDDPSSFAVVLTPSCDLAHAEGRRPKVSKALVAHCSDVKIICQEVGAQTAAKLRDKLPAFLSRGFGTLCIPLPPLPNTFPAMAAVLRDLELIELERIGDGDEFDYIRVASVDSPFREMIAWAYMQMAGRPGLPDRDIDAWTEEIIQARSQQGKEGKN